WEDKRRRKYSDKFEIHIVELPKVAEHEYPETALLKWAKFLNAEKKEEFEMAAKTDPHIRKAYEQLLHMSEDGNKRLIYEARQKAIYDYNTQVYSNWHSGYEQGEKNGISIGEEKKLIEQICKKMKKNLSAREIANVLEEDERIVQRIYDTARPFAPDYDIEKIRKRLNKEKRQETN
ncbi:PD-(D/E)XK nuclease family transposase, partial [Schaedlerella sp.]|uniref:PD-(D/E)XK nuclease family transposase n=1 Tax=Schaedlerella sp. TaxID=2676057 RepID=UPI0037467713